MGIKSVETIKPGFTADYVAPNTHCVVDLSDHEYATNSTSGRGCQIKYIGRNK